MTTQRIKRTPSRPQSTFTVTSPQNDRAKGEIMQLKRRTLYSYLRQHGEFPSNFREMIWAHLLALPLSDEAFRSLVSKGPHPSTLHIQQNYHLRNSRLQRRLYRNMSALSHWSPLCASVAIRDLSNSSKNDDEPTQFRVGFIESIVYALCKVLNDDCQIIETTITLLMNQCSEWCDTAPFPPPHTISRIMALLHAFQPSLLSYLETIKCDAQTFIWEPLQNLFTDVLSQSSWQVLMDHVFFFVNEPGQPDMLSCFSVAFITLLRPIILQMRSIPHDWFRTQASDYIDIHQLVHTAHRIRQSAPHSLLQRMFTSIPPFIPLPHKCIAYPVHDRVPIVVLNHRKAQMEDIQKKEEDLGRQMEMQSIVTKGIGKEKENEERWEKGKSEMRMIEKRRREAEQKRREEEQDKAERRKKSEEESKQKGLERVQKRTDLNKQKMAEAPKRIQFVDDRLKELNEQAQADEEELQERMEEDQIGELQRDALFEWIAENDSAEKKRDEDEQLRRDEEFGRLIAQRRRMYEAQKREEDAQRRPRLSNQLDEEREKEQKRRERMSEQQRQLFRNGISEQLGMADDEKANTMRLIQEDESWADRREREEERQRQAVSDQRRKRGKEDVEVEARKQQELQQQAEQDWMDSMKTLNVGRHARQRDRLRTDQTMKDLAEYEMALRKMQGALQQRLAAEEKFLERAKVDSLEYETKLDEKEGMINEGRRGVQNALNKQRDRMNDIVRTSEDVVLGGDVEWSHAWHAKQRDEAYRGMAQERRQHQRRREERDDLDQDIAERDAFQRRWEPHERRVREKGEKLDRMMEPFEFKGEQGETVFLRQNQDLHDTFTSPSRSFIVSRLD